jgi:hypothetical protein
MSRGPYTFKQRDLTRAIRATEKAGIEVGRIVIDRDGKIVIIPKATDDVLGVNEWDTVLVRQ